MTIDNQSRRDREAIIAFTLDHGSGVPTYLQLVHQVEHAVRLGYLVPGDQLPKVREVVASLAINPNTVLKAYRELEHKGLTSGRPGQGTFIQSSPEHVDLAGINALRKRLVAWLQEADSTGLDHAGITALFSSTLRDFGERGSAHVGVREDGEAGGAA
jgi:GntR family transcriptional regulator